MSEPEFGEPRDDLPAPKPKVVPRYWELVVAHAKANHGQWIPLVNSSVTNIRLQNIVWGMRVRSMPNIPIPMREDGMRSRWYRKTFYFMYEKPEDDDPWEGEYIA